MTTPRQIIWVDTTFDHDHLNLFIHDVENILNVTVLTCTSSGEALALYNANPTTIQAVITNQKRSAPDGPEAGFALLTSVRTAAAAASSHQPALVIYSRSVKAEDCTSKGFVHCENYFSLGNAICTALGVAYVLPYEDPNAESEKHAEVPTSKITTLKEVGTEDDVAERVRKGRATADDYGRIGTSNWKECTHVQLPDGRLLSRAEVLLEAIRLDPDNGTRYNHLIFGIQPWWTQGPTRVRLPNGRILNGSAEVHRYGMEVKKPCWCSFSSYRLMMLDGSVPPTLTLNDGRVMDEEDMEIESRKLEGNDQYPYRYALKNSGKGDMVHLPAPLNKTISRAEAQRILDELKRQEREDYETSH